MRDLDSVLRDHERALARAVASYSRPGPEREELAQVVALALVRAWPRFRGESSELTYLMRIAHNCGLRQALKRRKEPESLGETEGQLRSSAPNPEEEAIGRQAGDRLSAAVRTLPLASRQVITLALEELSHRDIADILGISTNAVGVRLHRARKQLEDVLGGRHG
ncbi:MAG: sigma-70 family RNA polymerase sigma factor [Acidobacteriota bacterium]